MAKNVRRLAYEFELDQCQRKSSQVNASGWPNEIRVERRSKTCVDLRRLASAFGQGFKNERVKNLANKMRISIVVIISVLVLVVCRF